MGFSSGSRPLSSESPKAVDYGQVFKDNPPPTGVLDELEALQQERITNTADGTSVANPQPSVRNAWTRGGEHCHPNNPKRSSRRRTQDTRAPSIDPTWEPAGTLFKIPYNSSRSQDIESSGQFGPRPGDVEWERVESKWEKFLDDHGLEFVKERIREQYPSKYDELKYGRTRSLDLRPAHGDDEYAHKFNDVLKTAVPTIAFKLTQQDFGRPVSPINGWEPLTRKKNLRGWDILGGSAEGSSAGYETVYHQEEELEFLDWYGEKSYGELMQRKRKAIPEEHIHRETPKQAQHLGGLTDPDFGLQDKHMRTGPYEKLPPYFAAAAVVQAPNTQSAQGEAQRAILVQAGRRGLCLRDTSYKSFCNLVNRLLMKAGQNDSECIVAIKVPSTQLIEEYTIDLQTGQPAYEAKIIPLLKMIGIEIGVRTKHQDDPFKCADLDSIDFRVSAPDFGYSYEGYAGYHRREHNLEENSRVFVAVLDFLFPRSLEESDKFILEVPGYRPHDIDRSHDVAVDATAQEDLSKLTGLEGQKHNPESVRGQAPKEVYVTRRVESSDTRATTGIERKAWRLVRPARKAAFDLDGPMTQKTFFLQTKNKLYPNSEKLVVRIMPTRQEWEEAQCSEPLMEEDTGEWKKFVKKRKKGEDIYVIKYIPKILVYDGTCRNPQKEEWDVETVRGQTLMRHLSEISKKLLGIDPQEAGKGIKIQVNRYKKEWLFWRSQMSDIEFLQEVFFKIDDGIINLYPLDWVTTKPFNEVEAAWLKREKEHLEKKQQNLIEAALSRRKSDAPHGIRTQLDQQLQVARDRQAARLAPESVYNNPSGGIQLPRFGSSLEPEISGGPDVPSIYPRVLTLSEIIDLQRRLLLSENELLQREEFCRVCGRTFQHDSAEARDHYQQHRISGLCPFCGKDWISNSRRERIEHLQGHAEGGKNDPISKEQPRTKTVCPILGCHADLDLLTVEQRVDHAKTHLPALAVTKEKPLSPMICSFPGCHVDLAPLTPAEKDEHHATHRPESEKPTLAAGSQPKGDKPEDPIGKPKGLEKPYCQKCLKCMNSIKGNPRERHDRECETNEEEYVNYTEAEARVMRRALAAPSKPEAKAPAKTRTATTRKTRSQPAEMPVVEADEEEEDEPNEPEDDMGRSATGTKRKRTTTKTNKSSPRKKGRQ